MIRNTTWIDAYKSANPQKERDMENKINIAEILKDCPKGMELDCSLWDKVTLVNVYEGYAYPIKISTPEGKCVLSQYGCCSLNKEAKCIIFPKGKTTWEGFVPPIEPKFKVGDEIVERNSISNPWIVSSVSSEYYELKLSKGSENIGVLPICEQDNWELVPNKFDISTLKAFDKVLVRDYNAYNWRCALYERYYKTRDNMKFATIIGHYQQCIPFEDNKHLLGTTDDCDDFYKTWEE